MKNTTLKVRNIHTGLEKEMSLNAWQHLKKSWELIGQVDADGNVTPLDPKLPQSSTIAPKKGNAGPAAERSPVLLKADLSPKEDEAETEIEEVAEGADKSEAPSLTEQDGSPAADEDGTAQPAAAKPKRSRTKK